MSSPETWRNWSESALNKLGTMYIYDLDFSEIEQLTKSWNEPGFRAKQIWSGLYKNFWQSASDFTNLPGTLRVKLAESVQFDSLVPAIKQVSSDGRTIKTLFALKDGLKIEAVLMRYDRRRTLCISTQVGCAMGCTFCATGQMGFSRNLSSGEIIAQVMYYAKMLHEENDRVTNIVIMGMGEPFHNYENTISAINRLNDAEGFHFGARRFTISTSGLIPAIRKFADEKNQVNLAVSLHASDDESRSKMMPVNNKYHLEDLIQACRYYVEVTGRRITFEWALINGVNDTPEQAVRLAKLLNGLLCHVNAIPLNPTTGFTGQATTRERAEIFKQTLEQNGIPCTIRIRRGIDIQAGCGQLASQEKIGAGERQANHLDQEAG